MLPDGLIILGFGGHARSVAEVALTGGVRSLMFVDDNAREGENFLGFPAVRALEHAMPMGWSCMPAIGDGTLRTAQFEFARSMGWPLAKVIATDASIHSYDSIGPGCFVGHHAHVGPSARVGEGCIINTGAIVEHESTVGNFSHVSVNAVVAGRSRLGSFVFLGAGAVVIDGVSVGDRITIGAGATVIKSLDVPGTYVGSPARLTAAAEPAAPR
ncbi:NeuD/PglB/VioB family sugar acetyltransferase [Bradyrhizobium sp. HKCCYLS2038]|uniref:NeuD/PglB/VioB family sugar acetyltransferase n=1 Tax=unclassified Bradyrhizobium TaxID=2631580 RepID=UPI003EBC167E